MSFALWWALTTIPGGLWPSLGGSGTWESHSFWFQTSDAPIRGRTQFRLQRSGLHLAYGAHPLGWAWQLEGRHVGLWWDPGRSLGASGRYRGTFRSLPWQASGAYSPLGWTARAQWGSWSWMRTYQGLQALSLQQDATRIEVQWATSVYSVGIRHGAMEWRLSQNPQSQVHLIRLRHGPSLVEWRSATSAHWTQQQLGFRTEWGPGRLWVYVVQHGSQTQTLLRASYSHTQWGSALMGFAAKQAFVRYTLPERSPARGSFVEFGAVHRLHLAYGGKGLTATWDRSHRRGGISLYARHPVNLTRRSQMEPSTSPAPCWIDVNYQFSGSPPAVELELQGETAQRVVLIPQNRQWKDHVPPGTYAVTGSAPKGWKLDLPQDSLVVEAGRTSQLWVALRPSVPSVRWIIGPNESEE